MDSQLHRLAAHSTPKELYVVCTHESIDSLSDGKTPLYYATYFRNARNVRYLVDNGADVNLSRPLYVAVLNSDAKCLSLLLKGYPSLDFDVEYLGTQVPFHHLVSISKRGMINVVVRHLVKTNRMTTEIANTYLMRYVASNKLEIIVDLLDLGIYRHRMDIPKASSLTIATAFFVTGVKTILPEHTTPYFNRAVKSSDCESMEIMIAQYPHLARHILVNFRDVLKSGKSYEFMLMSMASSDIAALKNFASSVISEIMSARGHEMYDVDHVNVSFHGEEGAQRIRERAIARLYDIGKLERLLRLTCIYANVRYGTRSRIVMGLPTLSDMSFFHIRLLDQRERLESLHRRIQSARGQDTWELVFTT